MTDLSCPQCTRRQIAARRKLGAGRPEAFQQLLHFLQTRRPAHAVVGARMQGQAGVALSLIHI